MANIYGITEGGGGGTINCYDEDIMRKPGSIGKATVFMEAKVVDDKGSDCPPGAVGELLAQGAATHEGIRLQPGDDGEDHQTGWLHTGDFAYKDEEGVIFFADRAKDLIIRGGENIFPAEIEDAFESIRRCRTLRYSAIPIPDLWRSSWRSSR